MLKGRSEKVFSSTHMYQKQWCGEDFGNMATKYRNPIKDESVDLSRGYKLINKERTDHEVDLILSHQQHEVVLYSFTHCLELTSDERVSVKNQRKYRL